MDKWISVSDKLPEKEGVYLCYFSDDTIETFEFSLVNMNYADWGVSIYLVSHWMPLPDPPVIDPDQQKDSTQGGNLV